MKQRLFLIYHGRYPSEKAASLFAAKSAEAFAGVGADVTLIVPRRLERKREDPYRYFSVRRNFQTVFLPTLDLYLVPIIGRFAHVVSYLVFSVSLVAYLLFRAGRDSWIYSNESVPLLVASFFFRNVCYEVHDFPERTLWLYRRLFTRASLILATNRWKAEELQKRFGVPAEKIIIEPNAVDLAPYENAPSRAEARKQLGLPADAKIAAYTGHLYAWKGVDTLAEAAKLMPEIQIYIVGGTDHDLMRYRERFIEPNLHFVGHRPHGEMPLWQKAADVLVLPNTAKEEISARYTSPMKLFEYMASGTPIVASDLPSIREIADGNSVMLIRPDDPRALAEGVRTACADETRHADCARARVGDHTWRARATRIFSGLPDAARRAARRRSDIRHS